MNNSITNITASFLRDVSIVEQQKINALREVIIKTDPLVSESVGKIMSNKGAFVYEQEGIFKYGLAKTSKHFTFHSMAMYAFPAVMDYSKKSFIGKGIRFQKGCINFKSLESITIDVFQEVLTLSSEQNFETVVQHYKNK